MKKKTFFATGAAEFIGMHTCLRLLNKDYKVVGLDNLSNYYDTKLKKNRLNVNKVSKSYCLSV